MVDTPSASDAPNTGARYASSEIEVAASKEEFLAILREQSNSFRARAKVLHLTAVSVLIGIAGIVGLGVYVFDQAGKITSTEVKQSAVSQTEVRQKREDTALREMLDRAKRIESVIPFLTENLIRFFSVMQVAMQFDDVARAIEQRFPKLFAAYQAGVFKRAAEVEKRVSREFVGTEEHADAQRAMRVIAIIAAENPRLLDALEHEVRIQMAISQGSVQEKN